MKFLLALYFTLFCPKILLAVEWNPADDKDNFATFTAIGSPGFLKINGDGGKITGSITELGGKVYGSLQVVVADIKTGIELRDKHMKEKYLEVEKFPKITFVLNPVQPNGTGFAFTGEMTIKGDTIPINGTAKANTIRPEKQLITANFSIDMKDLKSVGVPSYLGVTVADKVDVAVSFLAIQK